jgi:predicted GH43/DUF377 family glycosyl hydrolase
LEFTGYYGAADKYIGAMQMQMQINASR